MKYTVTFYNPMKWNGLDAHTFYFADNVQPFVRLLKKSGFVLCSIIAKEI